MEVNLQPNQRFLLLFVLFIVVGWAVIAAPPVDEHVIVPFTEWITSVSAAILNVLGQDVRVDGTLILSSDFAVDIQNGCNGIEAVLLIVAAIAAFPAGAMSRISGILAGLVLIQIVNFVRIVSLFLIGRYHQDIFQLFHTAVWQTLVVLAGVVIFLIWSYKFATPARVEASS
ncbi:MAG: exosortase H [Thermoanaerobaculia bacterium]|nr:exosortase H [Thermoanaerobaculia bacterium]